MMRRREEVVIRVKGRGLRPFQSGVSPVTVLAARTVSVLRGQPRRATGPWPGQSSRPLPATPGLSACRTAPLAVVMPYSVQRGDPGPAVPGCRRRGGAAEHCAHARFVWNLAVEQQSWWWPGRGSAPRPDGSGTRGSQGGRAVAARGLSQVQQQALRDFDKAMAAFFNKANPAGKPSFRSKRGTQGFVIRDTKARRLNHRWSEVFVPKLGWVRFRWTRPLPAKLGHGEGHPGRAGPLARVVPGHAARSGARAHGDRCRHSPGRPHGPGHLGRAALPGTAHQGQAGRPLPRVAAAHGPPAQEVPQAGRTRRAMAAIAADVATRKRDWAEKVSTRLVREHDLIALENLNIKGMTRTPAPKPDPEREGAFLPNRARAKAGLSRGILASAWGILGQRLEQKGAASGVTVVQVNPRFTSQQCHICGHISPGNRESQAKFRCSECGHATMQT